MVSISHAALKKIILKAALMGCGFFLTLKKCDLLKSNCKYQKQFMQIGVFSNHCNIKNLVCILQIQNALSLIVAL